MKIKILILLVVIFGIFSCENQDKDFDDYGTTAVYFPFQTPVRSLILGKYDLGFNDNDNNHRFEIGVTMTGVYNNDKDRKVYYEVAPELLDGVTNVQALPTKYYTIEGESPVTIPAGSIKGRIPVQLTEDFFDDTLSFAGENMVNYVIPLLITKIEELDTLLVGIPIVSNPMRVNPDDWEIQPKDYTLYGIKFMNKYQGIYLRRGVDEMTNSAGEKTKSVYHAEYVVKDELVDLTTTGKNNVELTNIVRRGSLSSPGNVNIELSFDDEGKCTISSFDGDLYNVSGSGEFVEDGDEWGDEARDVIYLNYNYTDAVNNETHAVKDTLVIRDRNVIFEEFSPEFSE